MIKNILLLILAVIGLALLSIPVFIRQIFYFILQMKLKELSQFFFDLAHTLDYFGGTLLYRTKSKTVSAVTGLKAYKERKNGIEFSYIYPFEKFIDELFDDPNHCLDAAKHEFPEEF